MAGTKITVASTPQEVVKSINAIVDGTSKINNTADSEKVVASAERATKDSAGQKISSTYIKNITASGTTVTFTKGDGTTGTFTTQDKDTIPTALKNPYSLTIQGNGSPLTNGVYDGSVAKTINITASSIGAAAAKHSHPEYATTEGGSVAKAAEAGKVTNALTLQTNGTTAGTFDGSVVKTINITASNVGALPASGGTVSGAMSVTGTLTLSKTTDLSGTANNSPALIVGGSATSAHIEMDNNEIQAKNNGTSVAALYLNSDGGAVNIGAGGLSVNGTINATTIKLGSTSILDSFAAKIHTHSYAGAASAGGAATSANKVNSALTIQTNGTTAAAFDGSAAKTVNITASNVGAAAANHTHNYAGAASAGGVANSAQKLNNGSSDYNVGNASTPIYFSNGVPVACTDARGVILKSWS